MESDLHIRVKVLELLSTSLKAEHFLEIQRMHPDYHCVDHDDPDNLLYFLEKEKQCISMKCYNGLVVLLNKLGLDEVANEIIAFHETPEEEYITLKRKIEAIFKDRNCRKEYMEKFRSGIVECYNFEKGDILESTMNEIIHDLENSQQLSRSMSHILRFQNVFKSCGCTNVVDLINSFENVMRLKEETPMDTSDAGAANTRPTPQQYGYPSQSTQEQNPGSSGPPTGPHPSTLTPGSCEPTTGPHPSTFAPGSTHWQHPGSSEPTTGPHPSTLTPGNREPTTGPHPSTFGPGSSESTTGPHPSTFFPGTSEPTAGPHPSTFIPGSTHLQYPGSSEPTTGQHPSTFNPASSHWRNPGIGEPTGQTAGFHQSANLYPHTFNQPHFPRRPQELQGTPCIYNTSNVGTNINFGPYANVGELHLSNPGQGDPGQWNHGQGGQGIYGQGSRGQGIHRQGSPGQDDYGRRNGQGANKYFPRQ